LLGVPFGLHALVADRTTHGLFDLAAELLSCALTASRNGTHRLSSCSARLERRAASQGRNVYAAAPPAMRGGQSAISDDLDDARSPHGPRASTHGPVRSSLVLSASRSGSSELLR